MRNEYIKFPETEQETAALIRTFEEYSDLPNIVHIAGAIDGTRIRIEAPNNSAIDYFSRYQQHDFVVQAMVDGRTIFIDHRMNRKTDDRPFLARFLMLT